MVENIEDHIESTPDLVVANASCLNEEIGWFASVVNDRLAAYAPAPPDREPDENRFLGKLFSNNHQPSNGSEPSWTVEPIPVPDLSQSKSVYAEFVRHYNMTADERLILMLTILPHIQPQLLDVFFTTNPQLKRGYSEFGGIKGHQHGGFMPTVETALFITSGQDVVKRFRMMQTFEPTHFFFAHNILFINHIHTSEPSNSAALCMTEEFLDLFTTGKFRSPPFSMEFPAKRLMTKMTWDDLVLGKQTTKQLDEIRIWLQHGKTLLYDWGMENKLKPGYKALFYGPPGTGKTLTATLLGKTFHLDVYRIDLSMVISKYIGETEKNLEKVFKRAENKNWILFFDEADALFAKRTSISDSHDKYANQEIAYLLQRLEDYPSLAVLATNMRHNIDEAILERIQSIIHFPKPEPSERLKLWQSTFSKSVVLDEAINLEQIARQYELVGRSIVSVVQFASLMALNRNTNIILLEDVMNGIRKEYLKEGRTM
ncbi:ATPase family protein associated with various cellular activities (AAA) [Dyadobacter jejuensis]|uniref:ATPase family protein associated with various cellular activities (AAA) n=1 Tax=Dyadobacter jejuensis TaxID=1082580 RepID=A0A316AJH5_9BACT|nr:ATP-binding protein [Dyadobacter jejuensis]PWJ57478.1 ATPase family protein associated with various cellular activities (AAA) [Dyadobacter jejuensis]